MQSLRKLDLNLLVLFEVLMVERHVSRTAEQLCLSQSAVSHALGRLRTQLDDPLLVRCGGQLQPTPRALAMLPRVREALQLLERGLAAPAAFEAAREQRCFRIACTDYFETLALPELLEVLEQHAPGIRIEVQMIGERASMVGLERGDIDLVVGLDRKGNLPAGLDVQLWRQEQYLCLCRDDALPGVTALTLNAYCQQRHVMFLDQADDTASTIDAWLAAQGCHRSGVARTVNYLAAARTVARTGAIITLPAALAALFSRWLPVRCLVPPTGIPALEMTIISHPLYREDPARRWLIAQLQALNTLGTH